MYQLSIPKYNITSLGDLSRCSRRLLPIAQPRFFFTVNHSPSTYVVVGLVRRYIAVVSARGPEHEPMDILKHMEEEFDTDRQPNGVVNDITAEESQ